MTLLRVSSDTPFFKALRESLSSLHRESSPNWGTTNAAQMLRHCSSFMDLYLGRIAIPRRSRLLSRLIGPLFLRSFLTKPIGSTPRNLGTMPAIRARLGVELDFDAEVARFLKALADVEALDGVVQHAMYGAMKAEDPKALVRQHTTHHFHQFQLV